MKGLHETRKDHPHYLPIHGSTIGRTITRLGALEARFVDAGFTVQTQRLCSPNAAGVFALDRELDGSIFLHTSRTPFADVPSIMDAFLAAKNVAFHIDLTHEQIGVGHVAVLTDIIRQAAGKTFNFTYTFNNRPSSPYFPSALYERDGFAIGLQPTDLAAGCDSIDEWLDRMKAVWMEIDGIASKEEGYLGIDSSVAPLFSGDSSFLHFLKRIGLGFDRATTTDVFVRISHFLKLENPRKVGLCGLMFPCLEDFDLAAEYEAGRFSIERNVYLSLHSGLGIDTYPIGVDETPERVAEILRLLQVLSNKYVKPLSARFISDGKAEIGERTDFHNQYLKDVIVRPL